MQDADVDRGERTAQAEFPTTVGAHTESQLDRTKILPTRFGSGGRHGLLRDRDAHPLTFLVGLQQPSQYQKCRCCCCN